MINRIDDQELDRVFRDMGMHPSGSLGGPPRRTPRQGLPTRPTAPEVPLRFRSLAEEDPAILDREGWVKQFMYGMGSPVIDTFAKVSPKIEARPAPQTMGEVLANTAGSMLTFMAVLSPLLLGPIGAAGVGALAGAGLIGAKGLGATIAKSAIVGGTMGAHRAWTQDKPIGKEMLSGAVWGGGLGAGFHGMGKALHKAGVMAPTSSDVLKKVKGDILSTTDARSMAEAGRLGALLDRLPAGKVESAREKLVHNLLAKKSTLPSHITVNDQGINVAGKSWATMKDSTKIETLAAAFKTEGDFDSLFKPVLNLVQTAKATALPTRSRDAKMAIEVLKQTSPVKITDLDTTGVTKTKAALNNIKNITEGTTFGQQWQGFQKLRSTLQNSSKRLLTKHKVTNLEELGKAGEGLTGKARAAWSKDVNKYVHNNSLLQDLNWKLGNHVAGAFEGRSDIVLPPTKAVNASIIEKLNKESVQILQKKASTAPQTSVVWHPHLNKIIEEASRRSTKAIRGRIDLPKGLRAEWDRVAANLKASGEPLRVARMGLHPPIALPAEISKSMANNYLATATDLKIPASFTSLQEALMLQKKPLPIVGEYLTPIRHLFGKGFAHAGRTAAKGDYAFKDEWIGKMDGWWKQLGVSGKELTKAGQKIGKVLEADVPGVEGIDQQKAFMSRFMNLARLKETNPKFQKLATELGLSNKELKVAYDMKKSFNKLFELAGLDPDQYIHAYLPHLRQASGSHYLKVVNDLKAKGLKPKEIKNYLWVHNMARNQDGATMEYVDDAFKAYTQYVTGLSKKIHFDDLFQHWDAGFKKLGMPEERRAIFLKLRDAMYGRPTAMEGMSDQMVAHFAGFLNKQMPPGARPTKAISSMLAELQYLGGIGYNPFTAVKNLTQKMLAISEITDDGNPVKGAYWMMKAKIAKNTDWGKSLLKHDAVSADRMFMEGLDHQQGAMEAYFRKVGAPNFMVQGSKKYRDWAFWMFKKSDIDNVQDTFLAKMMYLMERKGAPLADAVELATSTTMSTQFMYGFDSPMMYKGPIGRQLGIFMSWPLNFAQLLYNQGTAGEIHKSIATVGAMAIGSEVLSMTGMNFRSIHPVEVARGFWPIAMLEGEDSWPLSLRTASAGHQYIRSIMEGDPVAIDMAHDRLKQRVRPMIPVLGVQGARMLDFIDVAKNDWKKYDRLGRLRHEMTPGEALRGVVGPTMESMKRVDAWQQVSRMDGHYRKARRDAINAFVDQDYNRFEQLQEQLVINFGKWITPTDIQQELALREMGARERQLQGLPASIRDPYLEKFGIN